MRVSVIITTYGDPCGLARAMRSVLGQGVCSLELIVVDDNGDGRPWRCETEAVVAAVGDGRVIYLKHERNKGGSAARNTGINAARGAYIAFLDNDDFYLPGKISRSLSWLEDHDNYDAVLDDVLITFGQQIGGLHELSGADLTFAGLLADEGLLGTGSNLFLRASAVGVVGPFNENLVRNQDYEYMLRFLLQFRAGASGCLGVVKTNAGTSNIPSYETMKQVKREIGTLFADDIGTLDERDLRRYRENELLTLYSLAVLGHEEREAVAEVLAAGPKVCAKAWAKRAKGKARAILPTAYEAIQRIRNAKRNAHIAERLKAECCMGMEELYTLLLPEEGALV